MSSEILSKEPPPPLVDDRSTKKARFREQGVDADNPPPLSFKDKLMEDQNELEEEILGREEDLEFEPEDVIVEDKNSIPSISFSGKIQAQLVKPWMNTIVVKLLGRSMGYRALCNRLNELWRTLQGFTVIDLENDFFLVRFKSEIDAQYALTQGPWTILGHYLTVQQWTPHFDSSNVNIENIVAWIRIPGMPLHYYHKRILRMIGNVVGKVIKIDYNTESARRGKFARIAVEISLKKPLCSQFFLDGKLQNIEYENMPIICFNCGIYGHKNDDCPQSNTLKNPTESCKNNVAEDNPNGSGEEKSSSSEVPVNPSFGPWMIASRKGRGRVSKGGGYTKNSNRFRDGKSEGGSRFEVLENEETEEREIILPRQHNVPTTENEQPQSLSHIVGASMEDLARCLGIGERKDKRLYDTFHKRFKDVVSSHPPIPETPCQKDVKPSSVNEVTEVEKDSEGINKRRKKEPELTVKSALSAAFAKYADKMGKKKNSSPQVGETSASSSGAENSDSGKQDS